MIAAESLSETMKSEMKRVLSEISKKDESARYNITLTFTCSKIPNLNMKISREIEEITITQDLANNISDKIIANLELSATMYEILYMARFDLMCEMSFTPIDDSRGFIEDYEPMLCRNYRVILLNSQDIYKGISGARLHPADDKTNGLSPNASTDVTLKAKIELVDPDLYNARHIRIHGIFGEVRMIDVIRHVISEFGFAKAYVALPDNNRLYTNFVLPPDLGVAEVMGYLQTKEGLGIYNNGLCSYITNGTWFVFPRYGDTIAKRVVQIYSLGNNTIAGLKKFMYTEELDDGDTCTHVLLNTHVEEKNWSALGVENAFNAANVQLIDKLIIASKKLESDDKFKMTPVISNIVAVPTDAVSADNPVNISYVASMANKYAIESDLGSTQNTTLTFAIESCDPFVFTPNAEVRFNFDHADGYKSIPCKCEGVKYTFRRVPVNLYPIFAGAADVNLVYNNFEAAVEGNT